MNATKVDGVQCCPFCATFAPMPDASVRAATQLNPELFKKVRSTLFPCKS